MLAIYPRSARHIVSRTAFAATLAGMSVFADLPRRAVADEAANSKPAPITVQLLPSEQPSQFPVWEELRYWVELVAIIAFPLIFKKEITALVTRARTLKLFGTEITLGAAEGVLKGLLDDVKYQLNHKQKELFIELWRLQNFRLPDKFVRSSGDVEGHLHQDLRALRDAGLVRPQEPHTWKPGKHVHLMALGMFLVSDLDILKQIGIDSATFEKISQIPKKEIEERLNGYALQWEKVKDQKAEQAPK
jgi:hypothetical protein